MNVERSQSSGVVVSVFLARTTVLKVDYPWPGIAIHSQPLGTYRQSPASFLLECLVNSGVGHATQHCLAGLSIPLFVFRDGVGSAGSERPTVRGQQRG